VYSDSESPGPVLAQARKSSGIPARILAHHAGVTRSRIAAIERDAAVTPAWCERYLAALSAAVREAEALA
jgi:DNA-binding XRE family transcriptional regulator